MGGAHLIEVGESGRRVQRAGAEIQVVGGGEQLGVGQRPAEQRHRGRVVHLDEDRAPPEVGGIVRRRRDPGRVPVDLGARRPVRRGRALAGEGHLHDGQVGRRERVRRAGVAVDPVGALRGRLAVQRQVGGHP